MRLAFETKRPTSGRISLARTARLIYTEGIPSSSSSTAASSIPGDPSSQGRSKPLLERFPILKFYRGYFVSILGMIPYAGTSFLVWGHLQNLARNTPLLSETQRRRHRTLLDLSCGAIAGAMSQTASYPFEIVRRRMQVGGLAEPGRLYGFRETVGKIFMRNGFRGFFVGLSIGYLKVVPMTALSFTTWKAWFVCGCFFFSSTISFEDDTSTVKGSLESWIRNSRTLETLPVE